MIHQEKILELYSKNKRILLVGPYPPPIGGISVHLRRLHHILIENVYDASIYNTRTEDLSKFGRCNRYAKLLFYNKYDIVHVHGYRPIFFYITWFLKNWKSYDFYFTDHNARLFDTLGFWGQKIYRFAIKKLSLLILVNNDVRSIYKNKCHVLPSNIIVRNAFLPPVLNEERQIMQTYSQESKNFVNTRKPLIVANASRIVFFNGIDLYGLDMCVELIYKCKSCFPNIGLLFVLANSKTDSSYLEALKRRIEYLGISDNFHFMTGQKELWPLFKLADLCVRPTVSDGDAVSVRESLYFGCPVIASNAVQRPAGTVTFTTRDIDDLCEKVVSILESKEK